MSLVKNWALISNDWMIWMLLRKTDFIKIYKFLEPLYLQKKMCPELLIPNHVQPNPFRYLPHPRVSHTGDARGLRCSTWNLYSPCVRFTHSLPQRGYWIWIEWLTGHFHIKYLHPLLVDLIKMLYWGCVDF